MNDEKSFQVDWHPCTYPHTGGHACQVIYSPGVVAEPLKALCSKCGKVIKLETP